MLMKGPEENSDERILQQLSDRKFTLYTEHLERELPNRGIPLPVINAIIVILRLFTVISKREEKDRKHKEARRKGVEERIKREHTIKSVFSPFFREKVDKELTVINKAIDEDFFICLYNDPEFTNFLNRDQVEAFQEFVKFRFNLDMLMEAKKLKKPEYHGPTRTFYSNYPLLPPYKVLKD